MAAARSAHSLGPARTAGVGPRWRRERAASQGCYADDKARHPPARDSRRHNDRDREGAGGGSLPRTAVSRRIKLATPPLGIAAGTRIGIGRRLGGRPAELVAAEI